MVAMGSGERYYLPGLGRFIQQDSLTGSLDQAQSMNRYAYGMNNPMRYVDPTGNECEEVTGDVLARREHFESLGWVQLPERVAPPPPPQRPKNDEDYLTTVFGFYKDRAVDLKEEIADFATGGNISKLERLTEAYNKGQIATEDFERMSDAAYKKAWWNLAYTELETAIGAIPVGRALAATLFGEIQYARLRTDDMISINAGMYDDLHSVGEYEISVTLAAGGGALLGGRGGPKAGTVAPRLGAEAGDRLALREVSLTAAEDVVGKAATRGESRVANALAESEVAASSAGSRAVAGEVESEVAEVGSAASRGPKGGGAAEGAAPGSYKIGDVLPDGSIVGRGPGTPVINDPDLIHVPPTLSEVRALRNASVTKAERRAFFETGLTGDDIALYHGSPSLKGEGFDLDVIAESRRVHHKTSQDVAVFLTDDPARAMQSYGRGGQTARTVVPRKFAMSMWQTSGHPPLPEYKASTRAQVDVLNRNLEVLPTNDAIRQWLLGLP
jgi:hypothetical protein